MSDTDQISTEKRHSEEAVYIYDAPLRVWHWVNAFAILVLCVTGYFIGQPLPSVAGEAYDHYIMGYIRYFHFVAAYIVMIGFAFRLYWAFMGLHAKQIFFVPVWRKSWWAELIHEIKWYAMMVKEPKKYIGHNPLAVLTMHVAFVWVLIFMIITGLALYGEGTGMGTWQFDWFSSWVIPLFGQSLDVHNWHRIGMWVMICFVITHIYVAVREDIMSRQSIISSMISGWRMYKDSRPMDGSE